MIDKTIERVPRIGGLVEQVDWITEAESIGEVEIVNAIHKKRGKYALHLSCGGWEQVYVQIWGHGETMQEAAREAVNKARLFGDALPPHPRDC